MVKGKALQKRKGEKTHWLESPNKNYLGHQDLPNGDDLILTIQQAKWEAVKNHATGVNENKRIIRWIEKDWKPFICNETNAKNILKSLGKKFMEDCGGDRIRLTISKTKVMGEMMDCIRVAKFALPKIETKMINEEQVRLLVTLLQDAKKDEKEFCKAMKIDILDNLPASKFEVVTKRLDQIIGELQGEVI